MKTDPVAGALGDYRCFVDCAKLSAHRITNREEIWLTKRNAETLRALALHNLTASTAAHHAKAPVRRSSLIATVVTTSVREISDTRRKKGHTKAQKTHRTIFCCPKAPRIRLSQKNCASLSTLVNHRDTKAHGDAQNDLVVVPKTPRIKLFPKITLCVSVSPCLCD